jgi:hypothetical protein
MSEDDPFCKKIFKLGHKLNEAYSKILVFTGEVNKQFSSKENHRHMSMRQPKCLRKSHKFLIPVGPFMDQWGEELGVSELLNMEEKAEIVAALFEGYKRQDQAFGYCRAYGSMIKILGGIDSFESYLPYDLVKEIKKSKFSSLSMIPLKDFEQQYIDDLNKFVCPTTQMTF